MNQESLVELRQQLNNLGLYCWVSNWVPPTSCKRLVM